MTEIWLIRHGMTEGNRFKRYIGTTDEPLCKEGKEALKFCSYPKPEAVFVSPLLRCRETAEILFPGQDPYRIDQLAECDFGDFENKNYLELAGNPDYQAWIDSGGSLPFPGGESREAFRKRSLKGFDRFMEECFQKEIRRAVLVIHGGTIMNIMEAYGKPERSFYNWNVKNGHGYLVKADSRHWMENRKLLELVREL